jgi:hypothetical protein
MRTMLGKGNATSPIPEEFKGQLYVQVRFDVTMPTADTYAYDGVKLYLINWQRQRLDFLENGRVPCGRKDCDGVTVAERYGGVISIVREDGMHDYVCSVSRCCKVCSSTNYDHEWAVVSQLPEHLQRELTWQLTAAKKGVTLVLSAGLALSMQYSMTKGMGSAGWDDVLGRTQATSYAKLERGWLSMMEALKRLNRADPKDPNMQLATMADMGIAPVSAALVSKFWQDEFAPRAPYRKREWQDVAASDAQAWDDTFQIPARMGKKVGSVRLIISSLYPC